MKYILKIAFKINKGFKTIATNTRFYKLFKIR